MSEETNTPQPNPAASQPGRDGGRDGNRRQRGRAAAHRDQTFGVPTIGFAKIRFRQAAGGMIGQRGREILVGNEALEHPEIGVGQRGIVCFMHHDGQPFRQPAHHQCGVVAHPAFYG
ncbi:MAG: hypothetical protein HC841_09465, partial [Verrucomicrobiae bacterium]|nr:hypothetical protein [Verrucomicrobiae bacterium]